MKAGALALTVFCAVSGGPFGLEEMLPHTGGGIAILLILLIPLVWALPDALTTAELAAAIPEEGGYVIWVRRAMGPFASFLNAWWSWLYTLVDAAGYPVLFTTYLAKLIAMLGGTTVLETDPRLKWAVAAVVVVGFTILNIRGTKVVGNASSAFAIAIIVPFIVLVGIAAWRYIVHPVPIDLSLTPPGGSLTGTLSGGLALAMWNYLGWDTLSTIAEEVEEPEKAYPKALFLGIPMVTLIYLLPVLAGLAFLPDLSKWTEGSWPEIAKAIGGTGLAIVINVAGLVSSVALFTASLLGSSRIPFVLAEERFLPEGLVAVHPRYGTPWRALILCGAVYMVLVYQSFQDLVKVNVVLYAAALVLELASLMLLRKKEPNLPRPYRIPGGWPVLWLLFLMPTLVLGILVWFSVLDELEPGAAFTLATLWRAQKFTLLALISGPLVYLVVRAAQRRTDQAT